MLTRLSVAVKFVVWALLLLLSPPLKRSKKPLMACPYFLVSAQMPNPIRIHSVGMLAMGPTGAAGVAVL